MAAEPDKGQERKAKEIEAKFQADSYGTWLAKNRPDLAQRVGARVARDVPGGGAESKATNRARAENLRDDELEKLLTTTAGDTAAKQAQAAYAEYKREQSEKMADAVDTAVAKGDMSPSRNVQAPDARAFDNRARRNASKKTDPTTRRNGAIDFANVQANGTNAPTFSYQGLSEVLNTAPQAAFNEALQATGGTDFDPTRPGNLRVAVTGPGMSIQDIPNQIQGRQAALQADPKAKRAAGQLGRRDVSGIGAMLGQVGKGSSTNASSKAYTESMAYINSLTPDQRTRLQQHMVLAGLYSPTAVMNNQIMWGYPDQLTVEAWAQLHRESYTQDRSLADILREREGANAPLLQQMLLAGAGTEGITGEAVTVTISDPEALRSAAQDTFFKLLGRAPTAAEEQVLINSVQTSERAAGQQRAARATQIRQGNRAAALKAAGVDTAGMTDAEIAAAQGEVDKVLGFTPPSGALVMPVAGKNSFGNDIGQSRSGGRHHQGNDIFAAIGTPVVAAVGGKVERIGTGGVQGHMKSVSILGSDGNHYFYNHMGDDVSVRPGQQVTRGQVLGAVGDAPARIGTAAHLHFSINEGRSNLINPFPLLKGAQASGTAGAAGVRLPVGPGGKAGGASSVTPELVPTQVLENQDVDPNAQIEQWTRRERPHEVFAHGLGNAYYRFIDMMMAGAGGGSFGSGPTGVPGGVR